MKDHNLILGIFFVLIFLIAGFIFFSYKIFNFPAESMRLLWSAGIFIVMIFFIIVISIVIQKSFGKTEKAVYKAPSKRL